MMANGKFVAYYRVSTRKQGKSGLGLGAQQEAVRTYLNGGRWRMVGEFTTQLLGFAMKQTDPAERARILAEINRLLVNYLFDEEVRQG